MKKRNGNEQAFEYSYNINDACEKYSHDLLEFFKNALDGLVDEQVYFYEKKMMTMLMDQLKENEMRDVEGNVISKSVLKDLLKGFFRYKNTEQISALVKMAEEDSNAEGSRIEYLSLFLEEHEDSPDSFLNTIKMYIREERLNYANQIKEMLTSNR